MTRARRSGITVSAVDLPTILGMVARGDRRHDVAAWFGLNQGRIREVENGDHGSAAAAPPSRLPPSGSPGPKALALRQAVQQVSKLLNSGDTAAAKQRLDRAITDFDRNE
jgi:hypothetical protein